jgi:two-component system sensor histidine kinase ChiS
MCALCITRSDSPRKRNKFLVVIALALLSACDGADTRPIAHHGSLDLASWNFVRNGSLPLSGEWELFWGELFAPVAFTRGDAPRPDGWMALPSAWNNQLVGGKKLLGDGVATFRLHLNLDQQERPLGLWIQEQTTTYRLWFDGRLVAEGGGPLLGVKQVGVLTQMPTVLTEHSSVDVILQVANVAARKGGPTHPILLGDYATLAHERRGLRDLDVLLFGSLMVMGLYHAGLFLLRRKEKPALFIALICLAFGIRIPFFGVSGRPISEFLPGLSWELYSDAEALTALWGITAIPYFVRSILNDRWLSLIARWTCILALILTGFLFLFPRQVTEKATLSWYIVSGTLTIYLLLFALKTAWRGERSGWYLVIGWFLIATAGLFELLTDYLSPAGTHLPLVPFGVFAFLLVQAWVVAHRLYHSFSAVEVLSEQLQQNNAHLRRLETLKDEFLANTSHELRTPVHGIVGLSESLLQGPACSLSNSARESLELIVSSGRRLGSLIADILDLTRLQRDDIRLVLAPVDLRSLSSAVLALLEPVARAKGLSLINQISSDTPLVHGDENRLHQVLINLIGNAIKYTDRGEVRLLAEKHGNQLEWTVADTGFGIPPDKLDLIFNRSTRLEQAEQEGIPGAGLGLSIARRLVELHKGTIRAESGSSGSRFVVQLPLWVPDENSQAKLSADEKATASPDDRDDEITESSPAGMVSSATMAVASVRPEPSLVGQEWQQARVLVVDDDIINLRVVDNQLTLAGAVTRLALSGGEALDLLIKQGESFDLMLLDVMMPGLTGFEAMRQVRERYSPSELPIILLTARSQPLDLIQGFDAGANDYLVKPFSMTELLTRGLVHLELKRAFQALKDQKALEQELERQYRREELARLHAEQERLEKLRYQLNPHFLFNALTSIRGAISSDAEVARDMISVLGEYCRLTLAYGQRNLLSLAEEIDLARLYLRMDQARKRDSIAVEWQIAPGLDDFMVPTFLLQPLVENAVKYGRRTCPASGLRLRVEIAKTGNTGVLVRVSNVGTWVEPNPTNRHSESIGLENVRQRLRHHFGQEASLTTSQTDGWVHAEVFLPGPVKGHSLEQGK